MSGGFRVGSDKSILTFQGGMVFYFYDFLGATNRLELTHILKRSIYNKIRTVDRCIRAFLFHTGDI